MPTKKSAAAKSKSSSSSRPAVKVKRLKEVVFDEDARKEYLTGFSKRKKARELAVRVKAIDKEREEKNESRRAVRDERKERAATNVRNAKVLYGDAEGAEDSDFDDGYSSSASAGPSSSRRPGPSNAIIQSTAAYESIDLVTTVSIEPFSLSRSASPVPAPSLAYPLDGAGQVVYPEDVKGEGMKSSSKAGSVHSKKRVKNKANFKPKMTRSDKKERAKGSKKKKAALAR